MLTVLILIEKKKIKCALYRREYLNFRWEVHDDYKARSPFWIPGASHQEAFSFLIEDQESVIKTSIRNILSRIFKLNNEHSDTHFCAVFSCILSKPPREISKISTKLVNFLVISWKFGKMMTRSLHHCSKLPPRLYSIYVSICHIYKYIHMYINVCHTFNTLQVTSHLFSIYLVYIFHKLLQLPYYMLQIYSIGLGNIYYQALCRL